MEAEKKRLQEDLEKKNHWRRWGPYLSERQWGTVREDYSDQGLVWESFPHEQARSRAYRWGEDGLAGISDNHQRLCFALCLWNEKDRILKERLFGLANTEGNHGEDVKEVYYYLDNTPTHSYMQYLYKYPQKAFPYEEIVDVNKKRTVFDYEYELVDTKIFDDQSYFDVFIEYAKASSEEICIQVTVHNRGMQSAPLHVLPTLWFRNTWDWKKKSYKPQLNSNNNFIEASHTELGKRYLFFDPAKSSEILFTDNTSNLQRLYGKPNPTPYVKDAFHDYLIHKQKTAINPERTGTKAALHYSYQIPAQQSVQLHLVLTSRYLEKPFENIENVFSTRKQEAEEFYQGIACPKIKPQDKAIQRQAFAGLLWNKQYYNYVVEDWLKEKKRNSPINNDWIHLYNDDVLSVPDKWEYPCFFSWDTAFHSVVLSMIDPEFAKRQLVLLTREWNMHPNGQLPGSEWNFNDVNPPVHAWAIWRVFKIEEKIWKKTDLHFLERVYQKLLLNFTWWVNRKDTLGKNIFQGGFLGLDNISVFNRSEGLPTGWTLYQSDATSWMGMYCLNMLAIALRLAKNNPAYEDMASKFFEHFLYIADAINDPQEHGLSLWDEEDGFYYDFLYTQKGDFYPLKVRSLVGLIPLFAVTSTSPETLNDFPDFTKRMEWFLENRIKLCSIVGKAIAEPGIEGRRMLSIVNKVRLRRILEKMLDENEFLSPYGIRSLSKYHQSHPFILKLNDKEEMIDYEPAESTSRMFGGNSNWRGPIWLPLNTLIIESLQKYHYYYGDTFQIECPTGSGNWLTLDKVALELSRRLLKLFQNDEKGHRPCYGGQKIFQEDPYWNSYVLFYEYFHGDNGAGIGASHQTGWTALIAKLIQQLGENN